MSVQLAESASVDVLIAEDDATMRESLCRLLEGEGYHCAKPVTARRRWRWLGVRRRVAPFSISECRA